MAIEDLFLFPHFYIMGITTLLSLMSVIVVNIHKPERWRKIHFITAGLSSMFAVSGILVLGGLNLSGIHGIFGTLSVIILIMAPFGGFYAIKTSKNKKQIRNGHIWIGRATFLIVIITLILGIITFI